MTTTTLRCTSRRVCVVGAGYVGLTAAACFAHLGHEVACIESDPDRLEELHRGGIPIHEPGLGELASEGVSAGRLRFLAEVEPSLGDAEVVFLCVGTPPQPTGEPNLGLLAAAARQVSAAARSDVVVVVKSTVPPGSCEALELICAEASLPGVAVRVASSPEFLRESRAVEDFLRPDRVVVGSADPAVAELVASLYPDGSAVVRCDRRGAELVKYAANTFLAVKISFANEVARLCEALGTDATAVLEGVGLDHRIGTAFLRPGPGYGGSCLPKDVAGFRAAGEALGAPTWLAEAAERTNSHARHAVVAKLRRVAGPIDGRRVAVLGAAFKAGTDDTRDSPGLEIASELAHAGATVLLHDPLAAPRDHPGRWASGIDEAVAQADAVVLTTDAAEYRAIQPGWLAARMRGSAVVDAAGIVDVDAFAEEGLTVYGVGRGAPTDFAAVVWPPLRWAHPVAAGAPA